MVDLAKAHIAALKSMRAGFNIYNVGTGTPTSVLELITTFEKVNGVKVPYVTGPRRAGDPTSYFAVSAKIETELGWKAQKTIEDAVRSAWQWQQNSQKQS